MTTTELRAEPRIPVTLHGTLTLDDKSAPCVIQNMCRKGFLIKLSKQLPVGHVLRLRCELYPERVVECTVARTQPNARCPFPIARNLPLIARSPDRFARSRPQLSGFLAQRPRGVQISCSFYRDAQILGDELHRHAGAVLARHHVRHDF